MFFIDMKIWYTFFVSFSNCVYELQFLFYLIDLFFELIFSFGSELVKPGIEEQSVSLDGPKDDQFHSSSARFVCVHRYNQTIQNRGRNVTQETEEKLS